MDVKQIYSLVNDISGEILGKTDIVSEDLTGIIDLGTALQNASAIDNYVKSLVNHIGKVIFVSRPYSGKVPSVVMDNWEFGSVLEKISADIPAAFENNTWQLTDKQEYSQDVFYKPVVTAKFFNSKTTFEIPISITERQVKESFSSAAQLNGFISMIYSAVEKSFTIKLDGLIMRTINNMIGETINADKTNVDAGTSTVRAVNLLADFNAQFGKTLSPSECITDPDFIRYAAYQIGLYVDRMQSISTLFNIGGKERFTPRDYMRIVLLSDFAAGAKTYLYSDTFHAENVQLPTADTVPYWQGSGKSFSFADNSTIKITTSDGAEIEATGILGIIFDKDSLGVCNLDRRVTTNYNAKAEFFNNYYKFDAGYFNDLNENFVVFYVK